MGKNHASQYANFGSLPHKRYWISEYSKLEIPIPPQKEQKRIVFAVHSIFAKLDMIMESL